MKNLARGEIFAARKQWKASETLIFPPEHTPGIIIRVKALERLANLAAIKSTIPSYRKNPLPQT